MSEDSDTTACFIIIGDEILSGRTQDVNLGYLGAQLDEIGIRLHEARVVLDSQRDIIVTVNECRQRYDYVFTSGGIGPTHDDITTEAMARAFGVAVVESPEAVQHMRSHYGNDTLSKARLKMACVPEGAQLIDNPISAAPGFRFENVYVFAGIPEIMRAMFESIRHTLSGGPPMQSTAVNADMGESRLAPGLASIQQRFPELSIGSYPYHRGGRFGSNIVIRGTDPKDLARARTEVEQLLLAMRSGLGDDEN